MIRKKADHAGKAEKKEKGVVFIMLICLGYMAMVIVGRCETTAQKVMLPLVACLIGAGFCRNLTGKEVWILNRCSFIRIH